MLTMGFKGQIPISIKILRFKKKSSRMKEITRKKHHFIVTENRLQKFKKVIFTIDPTIPTLVFLLEL